MFIFAHCRIRNHGLLMNININPSKNANENNCSYYATLVTVILIALKFKENISYFISHPN